MIDFWLGQPHPSILEAARRTIAENCLEPLQAADSPILQSALQYGENMGEPAFLAALTQWLNETLYRNVDEHVSAAELFVTNGASQALLMLARALCALRRRRVVFCEEATYFLALDVFVHDLNLTVRGVPTDEHGIEPHALEAMLQLAEADTLLPAFIYLIPTHHNPTARTVSDDRRRELIAIARRFNVAIVADDPYALLSFRDDQQQQLTPMSALGYRHVYDVGSFSKILAPGVRLGWVRTRDAELLADLNQNDGLIQSGGGLAPFTSAFVRSLLTGGAQLRFIAWLRQELRQRCAALCDALQTAIDARRQLIDTVHFVWPRGGYFVWLHVGDGAGKAVAARALQRGVRALPGTRCLAEPHDSDGDGDGDRCKGRQCRRAACSLRLCFAWASRDDLVAGAHALVSAIVSENEVATDSHRH